jgi:hypothetical protein
MTTRRPRGLPIALLATLLAAVAAPLPAQQKYTLRGDDVAVYNLVGEMRVEAGSGTSIVAEVTPGGRDAGRVRVETGPLGGGEALRVVYPGERLVYPRLNAGSRSQLTVRSDGTFGGGGLRGGRRVTIAGSGSGAEAYADVRVRVPAGGRVAVHQGVGKVWVENVDGELLVRTSSAPVEAENVRGKLRVDVGSGSVQVRSADADLDLDTGSGNVAVAAVRGPRLRIDTGSGSVSGSAVDAEALDVDTGSGSVRLAQVRARSARIDTGSGAVDLSFIAPVEALHVDTGSGGVTLTLPRSQSAALEIDTGSGGIRVDLPLQTIKSGRSSLRGRLGEGSGGRIRIDTGSGGVRVKEG